MKGNFTILYFQSMLHQPMSSNLSSAIALLAMHSSTFDPEVSSSVVNGVYFEEVPTTAKGIPEVMLC